MKIELETKPGYEWVECDVTDYYDAPLNQPCAMLNVWGDRKYYILKTIKPKYDYSSSGSNDLLNLLVALDYRIEAGIAQDPQQVADRIESVRYEILRRMNREQS